MKALLKFTTALVISAGFAGTAFADATVNIIHGIRGQDLGLDADLPVDVYVNGNLTLEAFQFGDIVTTDLPAGAYDIDINLGDDITGNSPATIAAGTGLISVPDLPLLNRENSTVIAHLNAGGGPTASKFVNRKFRSFGPFVPVTYHHTTAAPAVDVYNRFLFFNYRSLAGVQNGQSGTVYNFLFTPFVAVTPANTFTPVLGPARLPLERRTNHRIYVVGSANGEAGNTLTVIVLKQ
jgi:hypothetical protein